MLHRSESKRVAEQRSRKCLVKKEILELRNELERAKNKISVLEAESICDEMTGIFSQKGIASHIEHHLALLMRSERERRVGRYSSEVVAHDEFAFLLFDIDRLKYLNDTYGHHVGDLAIKTVASFLSGYFNRSIDIVGRWYRGDEFVVILCGLTPKSEADKVRNQVLMKMSGLTLTFNVEETDKEITIPLRASVGVSSTSEGHRTQKALFEAADKELLEAKSKNRAK